MPRSPAQSSLTLLRRTLRQPLSRMGSDTGEGLHPDEQR
jgi:hypothetical protein